MQMTADRGVCRYLHIHSVEIYTLISLFCQLRRSLKSMGVLIIYTLVSPHFSPKKEPGILEEMGLVLRLCQNTQDTAGTLIMPENKENVQEQHSI